MPEDEVIVSSDIEAELQEALEKNNKNFMSYIMPSSVIECLDTKNTVVVDIKNEIIETIEISETKYGELSKNTQIRINLDGYKNKRTDKVVTYSVEII